MRVDVAEKITKWFVYMLGITSTMYIVSSLSTILSILCIIMIIIVNRGKIKITASMFLLFILSGIVSTVLVSLFDRSHAMYEWKALLHIMEIYLCSMLFDRKRTLLFFDGLRISCMCQVVWVIAQIFFYYSFRLDINQIIFSDILHAASQTSRYAAGLLIPSGLCWHPSNLVVVFVLTLLFYDKWVIRALVVILSFFTRNMTAIIAVFMTIVFLAIQWIFRKKHRRDLKRKNIIFMLVLILLVGIVILSNVSYIADAWKLMKFQVLHNLIRVTKLNDSSSRAHMQYYLSLIYIWGKSTVLQIFFGYGIKYSGLPFSRFLGQYRDVRAWAVESDVMNLIYGSGIIGTVSFYLWYIRGIVEGRKKDIKYAVFFSVVWISGFFYYIQYEWVLLVELLIMQCMRYGIKIFSGRKESL